VRRWQGAIGDLESIQGATLAVSAKQRGEAVERGDRWDGIGVYAKGGRFAGFFEGAVTVTGPLTAQGVNLVQRIQQLEGQLNQANQAISAAQQRANQAEQKANAVQKNLEQALTPVSLKITALEEAILKLQGISHTHS